MYAPVERLPEKEALPQIHTRVQTVSGSIRTVGGDRPTIAWIATVYAQIHDQPEVVYKKGDALGRQSVELCLVARIDTLFVFRCSTGRIIQ